jgi:hypothetical protein
VRCGMSMHRLQLRVLGFGQLQDGMSGSASFQRVTRMLMDGLLGSAELVFAKNLIEDSAGGHCQGGALVI